MNKRGANYTTLEELITEARKSRRYRLYHAWSSLMLPFEIAWGRMWRGLHLPVRCGCGRGSGIGMNGIRIGVLIVVRFRR